MTAALIASAFSIPASAKSRYDTVTVTGDFRDQRITAPVRHSELGGSEVRLPGGGWIDCGGDCRSALKDATFDFWNIQEDEDGGGGGGGR
ncbi:MULTISPECIES: hypothetical protein [Rhodomicrobium]|uniref:hypothetical protein n=1 Tax=Rhodomicrobium TaxID=1068 RepID=UPI000F73E27B|nr:MULTISPECIES: hypothetical protein [Rhodomicrobium]